MASGANKRNYLTATEIYMKYDYNLQMKLRRKQWNWLSKQQHNVFVKSLKILDL